MKTFFRLLTLFMAIPVIELALLLKVSQWTGFWPTVALIIVTAVAGSYLAKREGLSAWNRLQGSLSEGGLPGDELLDAVIVLVAGAFLITPGVLTDLVGFTGMLPLTRGWIRRLVKRRLKKAMREGRLQTSFGTFGSAFDSSGMAAPMDEPVDEPAANGTAPEGDGPDVGGPVVGGTPAARGPSPGNGRRSSSERQEPSNETSLPPALADPPAEAPSERETPPPSRSGAAEPDERDA